MTQHWSGFLLTRSSRNRRLFRMVSLLAHYLSAWSGPISKRTGNVRFRKERRRIQGGAFVSKVGRELGAGVFIPEGQER
jgi:hypothetical protein